VLPEVLHGLAEDFYENNPRAVATHSISAVKEVLGRAQCGCKRGAICYYRSAWKTPNSLAEICRRNLAINLEATSDVIHRNRSFPEWVSTFETDAKFGARSKFVVDQAGQNAMVVWNPNESEKLKMMFKTIDSESPTRILLLAPSLLGQKSVELSRMAKSRKLLELVTCEIPTQYVLPENAKCQSQPLPDRISLGIYLYVNGRSLLYDPIDFQCLSSELQNWITRCGNKGSIPKSTTLKFLERKVPARNQAEARPFRNAVNPFLGHRLNIASLKRIVGPELAKQISKINQSSPLASSLGLFPSALTDLIRQKFPDSWQEWMDKLSHRVIKAGLTQFERYQRESKALDRLREGNGKSNLRKCQDPFHFLDRSEVKPGLAAQTCICDLLERKRDSRKRSSRKKAGLGTTKEKEVGQRNAKRKLRVTNSNVDGSRRHNSRIDDFYFRLSAIT
jgi:hypothetical protein